jgi:death-on-curing protein
VTQYLSLAEYFWLAEQVTGTAAEVLVKVSRSDLAGPALHAPQAGFGDEDFYPDYIDKAAVLTCRLAWNHPSPTATSALRAPRTGRGGHTMYEAALPRWPPS